MSFVNKLGRKYEELSVQVKASIWFLVCSFLQRGISVITTPIFTRLLTTSEYGQYNVFNSWLGIVAIFVSLRLSYGVYSQGLVKFEEDRNRFSSSMQGLNLALTLLWTFVYFISRSFWNRILGLTTVQVFAMLVMIWSTNVFEFWAAEQRVIYSYKKLVLLTLIVSFAKPLVGIVFVINAEDKVTARILGLMLVELIAYPYLCILQVRKGKTVVSKKYWKYAVGFNLPLIPHYLSQTVLNSSDRIMISRMVGEGEAGIYSLAYALATLMLLVSTSLSHTITPWIYQKIKAKRIKEIPRVVYIAFTIIALANLALIAFAPEIVKIFSPISYHNAIWIIPPVSMSVYLIFCYDIFSKFAFYYDKTRQIMLASIIGAALNILLNYIFIGMFGYIAAGYTTLICYFVYVVLHYVLMRKIIREQCGENKLYDIKVIFLISFGFMTLGFLYLLSYKYIYMRLGITLLITISCLTNRKKLIAKVREIVQIKRKIE